MIPKDQASASDEVVVGGGLTPLPQLRGQARAYASAEVLASDRFHRSGGFLKVMNVNVVARTGAAAVQHPSAANFRRCRSY